MVLIQSFLQGLLCPDYEGKAAYMAEQAGHATLDSIRAVLGSGLSGISKDPKPCCTGISCIWMGRALQRTYAIEVQLAGAAVGGFVTNITATAQSIDGTASSGSFTGLAAEYSI